MALDFPSSPTNGQVYDNFIYDSTKGTWKSLSSGASPSILVNPTITNAVISATAPNATTVPLTVKGAASQSANLQEWKNSSNVVSSRITSYGSLHTPTLGVGLLNPPDTGGEVVLQTYGRQTHHLGRLVQIHPHQPRPEKLVRGHGRNANLAIDCLCLSLWRRPHHHWRQRCPRH